MQDSIHIVASAISAALLALACSVLDGPLLAVVVALLVMAGAGILVRLATRQLHIVALEQRLRGTGAFSQRHFGA